MGLLLILIPWSAFWDRNYFAQAVPWMREVLTSNYVRGAVTGLGLINVYSALMALADLFSAKAADDPFPPASGEHGRT